MRNCSGTQPSPDAIVTRCANVLSGPLLPKNSFSLHGSVDSPAFNEIALENIFQERDD